MIQISTKKKQAPIHSRPVLLACATLLQHGHSAYPIPEADFVCIVGNTLIQGMPVGAELVAIPNPERTKVELQ